MRDVMDGDTNAVPEVASLFATYERAMGSAAKHEAVELIFDELHLEPGIYIEA